MKYIFAFTLFISYVFADVSVEKTVTMTRGEHTSNEVRDLLLQKAKREAANEIFGDFISSSTKIKNGRLAEDSILALVVGRVHVKGSPKYSHGEGFDDVKVTIRAYATQAEIKEAKKILDQRVAALHKAEKDTGVIVSNTFKGVLKTNKGSKQDVFYKGDEIELYVLLNRPGYYYLKGKLEVKGEPFTYLVDLEDANGMDKFVGHVSAQNTNKWISLGAFIVEAPFGIENLQMVSSNKPFKSVPKHYYDDTYGYYFIEESVKIRGFKKKNLNMKEMSVSTLSFTTLKK